MNLSRPWLSKRPDTCPEAAQTAMNKQPMTEDRGRLNRIDRLIAEMEATIAEARETSERMTRFFREMGIEDEFILREMARSENCSPALRKMVDDDLAELERELKEEESGLMAESGYRQTRKPHRRRREMIRI